MLIFVAKEQTTDICKYVEFYQISKNIKQHKSYFFMKKANVSSKMKILLKKKYLVLFDYQSKINLKQA